MADDPVAIVATPTTTNIRPGLILVRGQITGPADYDNSGGAAFDLSSYLTTVKGVKITGTDAQADAGVLATYLNAGSTAAGGFVTFGRDAGSDNGGAKNARVIANVADTTNLSGLTFWFEAVGTPPTRT